MLVERNEVHLRRHALEQARKPLRIVQGIVDVFEHHVLKRNAAASGQREGAASVEEFFDVPLLVHGHDFSTRGIGGCIKADGDVHFGIFAQIANTGCNA